MQVHQQPCHIVYTDYRPTPLQHYLFPTGGDGLYLVVDEKGKFREDSFQKALNALVSTNDKKDNGKWQKGMVNGRAGEDSDIFKMVKMIIQRQYDPVIIFSFSKRECEFLAMQMAKMDLNEDDEKVNIETIFWSAMDMLSDDDKKLPQARSCRLFVCSYYNIARINVFNLFGGKCLFFSFFAVPGVKYASPIEAWNWCASFWLAAHIEGSH